MSHFCPFTINTSCQWSFPWSLSYNHIRGANIVGLNCIAKSVIGHSCVKTHCAGNFYPESNSTPMVMMIHGPKITSQVFMFPTAAYSLAVPPAWVAACHLARLTSGGSYARQAEWDCGWFNSVANLIHHITSRYVRAHNLLSFVVLWHIGRSDTNLHFL